MLHVLRTLCIASLALLALHSSVAGQCIHGDNLDGGPCCGLTQAHLPFFKNFQQDALDICWRDCGVDQLLLVRGRWFNIPLLPGTQPPCGERRMRLDIIAPPNVLLWRGQMKLNYSRTWMVVDNSGISHQVWRFLVNGDLRPFPAAGLPPCPVPPCVTANNNRARFTGYVDFMEDCNIPTYQYSWMLTHACDTFDHHVGFPRAGVFHPDRSYSFVAPAASFVPGPLQPVEGTPGSPFDAVRHRLPTPPPVLPMCTFEEPVVHTLTPQQQLCFCGLPGTNQWMWGDLDVQGPCGTALRNPPGGPLLPGFVSMGLGSWTNPNVYPGVQALRWNIGAYDFTDVCQGVMQHEVYYGVTTLGGWQAFQIIGGAPGAPLPPVFIDQQSAHDAFGSPRMNTPFTPQHFVTLNH